MRLKRWFAHTVLRSGVSRYLLWFAVFWVVQVWTWHRPVCAQLVHHRVKMLPFGVRHIHWCRVHEGDHFHEVHYCHACPVMWYDNAAGGTWVRQNGESELTPPKDDAYGFQVYPR